MLPEVWVAYGEAFCTAFDFGCFAFMAVSLSLVLVKCRSFRVSGVSCVHCVGSRLLYLVVLRMGRFYLFVAWFGALC